MRMPNTDSPLTGTALAGKRNTSGSTPDARLFVNSVEKAIRVLTAFDPVSGMLPITEIAERTGLGRSATQRFVYTLHWLGYLTRDPVSRRYGISPKFYELAHHTRRTDMLAAQKRPVLMQLAQDTGETVAWVELDGDDIVIIDGIPSVHAASVELPIDARYPALTSSSGQVLLSRAPIDQLLETLGRLPPEVRRRFGDRDTEEILALFARTRRQGYSMTEKNMGIGTLSISAPVFDKAGQIVAALNLSTIAARHNQEALYNHLLPLLIKAAQAASE
ncbi:IclR family transcriptional regulator [Pollutimonas sp. H1-120]|uniref:IclR family transcriptional regulator n=1 Tax=Pollutimonas sp. H1-120 TaxID=3148824 RepID=UPI003B52BEF3